MKIPIKDFVLSILEEKELPKMTATKQQSKPYNELVGKTNNSKGIPPENNGKLQEVLYKSRQPEPTKPSRSLIQDKINEGKIVAAQIKSQGQ